MEPVDSLIKELPEPADALVGVRVGGLCGILAVAHRHYRGFAGIERGGKFVGGDDGELADIARGSMPDGAVTDAAKPRVKEASLGDVVRALLDNSTIHRVVSGSATQASRASGDRLDTF